jgi:hypothetical protein
MAYSVYVNVVYGASKTDRDCVEACQNFDTLNLVAVIFMALVGREKRDN